MNQRKLQSWPERSADMKRFLNSLSADQWEALYHVFGHFMGPAERTEKWPGKSKATRAFLEGLNPDQVDQLIWWSEGLAFDLKPLGSFAETEAQTTGAGGVKGGAR